MFYSFLMVIFIIEFFFNSSFFELFIYFFMSSLLFLIAVLGELQLERQKKQNMFRISVYLSK